VRGSTIRLGITEALTARQCSRAGDFHRDAVRVLHEALAGRAIREWPQTIVADPHCIETSEHPVEVLGVEGNVVKSVGCRRGALGGLVQMDGRLVVIIESRSWEAKLRSGTVNKPKSIAVKRNRGVQVIGSDVDVMKVHTASISERRETVVSGPPV
jgi:hypothetical protein